MKNKMIDLWMQIEGTKLIFVMNFSVLDFFKFASRMPQFAQIFVSTFKIFPGGGTGGIPPSPTPSPPSPPDPPKNFPFFSLAIPASGF